ncbi:hypothetical protein KEM07_24945 [Pseudomonas carnis]|nr:hypothetical protein [Pseudomonas carnis]MBV2085124.1 hypothetical protein [Pseudomonas carnis]
MTLSTAYLPAISASECPAHLAVIHRVPVRELVNYIDQARRHLGLNTAHNNAPALGVSLGQEWP